MCARFGAKYGCLGVEGHTRKFTRIEGIAFKRYIIYIYVNQAILCTLHEDFTCVPSSSRVERPPFDSSVLIALGTAL